MENTIKPYEISLWEDVYDEQRKVYTEKKILIIGSSSMKTSNRAFSPILRQNLNGETTLEFSLLYKVYNEFTHIKTINPFMPFLVNERKVKLKYGDEWFDFILKEKQESSENTFTYSCSDANILELSKQGYNVTFSSELNNNQGTAIELGTIALEGSNWSIDEEKSDILRSYTDEPVYKGELNQDITVYNMEKPNEDAITLKKGEVVYLFYSQIFEQKTTDLQLVKADEKFVYDDNGVAKGTNYRYTGTVTYDSNKVPNIIKKGDAYEKTKDTVIYTNKDYYILEGGAYKKVDSPQLIELPNYYEKYYSSAIFTDYQVKRLVRKPSVTYDKVTGKMVDIYTAPGAKGPIDIYHYTDTLYSTPDILVDYMANGNNFDLSIEGSTNGWTICSDDSTNNSIVVDTYPTLEMITNSPGYLVDVRNYLIITLNGGAYVYNSGIQGNRYLIKEFVQGEKYSFKIRAGQLSEGKLVGLTEAPKFKMVIASYTYGENGRPVMGNVLFDFVETKIDGLDSPRIENIEVSNGVFGENKTQYVVDGVVQAPSPMYYYREGDGALHKWNPNTKQYEKKTTEDLDFYRYDAICKRSIGDLITSTEEIGIFIQNTTDSQLTYYIESIQLFKHIIIDGKTAMIGDIPSAVNINKDYFYLAPAKDAKKSSVKFYSSKATIASSLGIDENLIKLKFDENCQMVSMIEVDNSNYFDILQQICEKFECWLKFEIEREENGAPKIDSESGKPIKKIAFKKYIGKDNYAGFKYGINLVKIDRTVSSEEIVTKLIVPESENQYADGGSVTIQKAPSNISGSSYILNFNYFVKQGLLDSGLNDLVDFYNQMKEKNASLIEKRAEKSKIDLAIVKLESQRNVFSELLKNAQSTKDEAKIDFKRVANTDYDTYIRDNNPLDKNKDSVLDLVTQIKVCDHYISTYKSSTQSLYKALETQRRKSEGYPERVLEIIEVNGKYVWSLDDYFEGLVFTLSRKENEEIIAEEVFETNFYTKSGSTSWAPTQITFNHIPDGYKQLTGSIDVTLPFSITIEAKEEDRSLKARIEKEEKEKDRIEREFLNKFGPFIQEGTWNSNEYIDSELYYLDAVKAAYNSGKPQVEYSIDVIEISGLEDYEGYEFKIGDKTYIEDTEFFGYIQINGIPTPVKEEVVVSEIIHHLDSPEEDSISVKNYKTEFEDLFQRLAATTQSIQYKEGSYARAASAIDVSGIINPEVLLNTFGAVGNQVWDLTTNGIIKITGDGIITTDLHDANNKIKVGAGIIYTTTDGGQTWVEAFTPTGMKTSFLKAGVINTDKIFIMNDNKPAFRWDKVGLNAFSYDSKEEKYKYNTFVRFDQYGIYGVKMPEWEDQREPGVPESDYEYFVPDSITDVEDKATFGLTWNGFFLKSLYKDGSVSISNTDDIEVKREGKTIIKIGAFRNIDNPYKVEKYGIRISDYNGTPVFETGDDGRVYIKDQLQVGRNEWNHSAIIIDGANSLIKSSNYSDGGGLGWLINQEGDAFFNNITARGAIRTAVFEYSEIQAVGGIFLFRPSAVIKSAKIIPKTPTEEYGDIIITLDKQYLFDIGDWCKIGNYLGENQSADASLKPEDILKINGLTHVYKVVHATGNTIRLDEGQRLIEEGIVEVDSEGFIPSLAGAALINMGNEAQTNNYGIGINSSDNTVNLPRRSISLFETRIHRDSEVKVSYDFSNVLGTLPYISDLKVDSDIYNKYMKETQGIFTNNMYIGDRNQYIAFYTDDAGLAHLKINASELIFGHDPVTQEEISWNQLINQLQENTIISSLGYQITSKDDYGYIYPRAFKNGVELDPLPFNVVDNHGETLPERPKEGDYFLLLDRENKKAICKKFTDGKWVDVIWECEYEWEFLIGPNGVKPSVDSNFAKNRFVYVDYDVVQDGFTANVAITNYIGEYFLEYNNKYFRVQYEDNPEEVRYILTRDKRIVPNKTYYRYNSVTQKYEVVAEPKQEEIGTYYEIDERFFLVKKPDLLKTYESITIQNGLSQRYFWFNTSDRRTGDGYNIVSSGAYVLDTPAEEFKREHKGHYVLVRSKGIDTGTNYGIIIGKDLIKYMILNDLGLTLYNPEGAKAMELTQEQLAFYDKNEKLRMNLDSESLNFYDKNETARMNLNSESLNFYDKDEILRMEFDSESLNFYDKNEKIRMSLTESELAFYRPNTTTVNNTGLIIYDTDGTTSLASFSEEVIIGKINSGHIKVSTSGLHVYTGSEIAKNDAAFFGATARIGRIVDGDTRIEIQGKGLDIIRQTTNSKQEILAHFGYETVNTSTDTSTGSGPAPYYSLGIRRGSGLEIGQYSVAEGSGTKASGSFSHAEGYNTTASGTESHAEGGYTTASGFVSHAEGYNTTASGSYSHAEGYGATASGSYSHAEGYNTTASGNYSHAEGYDTTASEIESHAEGWNTAASGKYSHAEGYNTTASGTESHAEGGYTTASGFVSHAEGYNTTASGTESHAGGYYTHASRNYQTVIGKFNKILGGSGTAASPYISTDAAFIIGGGDSQTIAYSKDIFSVDWSGNVSVNGTLVHSSDRRLKKHISYLSDEANDFIRNLKPAYFKKEGEKHVGFYAQDVEKIDKWNCMTGEMNGYKTLGYSEIIAPLVAYCQHLEKRIKKLEGGE